MTRFLAVDYGARRLGLALSNEEGTFAMPHASYTRRPNDNRGDWTYLLQVVASHGVTDIVFGRPGGSAESDKTAAAAERFAQRFLAQAAEAGHALQLHWWDERFSTAEALRYMAETGFSQRKARDASGPTGTDARAAAVILQGFLDARQPGAGEEREAGI